MDSIIVIDDSDDEVKLVEPAKKKRISTSIDTVCFPYGLHLQEMVVHALTALAHEIAAHVLACTKQLGPAAMLH
jgi:hypothetical protein